jgi:hypothetical protein
MQTLDLIRLIVLIIHFVGLAAIIGPFILQRARKEGFQFGAMLTGSIVQIASGAALIGLRKGESLAVSDAKMAVKLGIAVIVLALVVIGMIRQRRLRARGAGDGPVRPLLIGAGIAAIVNVAVAVLWE